MASNIFGRYIWLIDILQRYKRLTFEEINQKWTQSGLSYGVGDDLPLRTFHNHRKAIKDIFDVYIECDAKDGYRYYIDEPERLENDALRSWLINSYATLNQMQADKKLEGRIVFENIPSGDKWLTVLTAAMRVNHTVLITYHRFGSDQEYTFELEPYCLRVFNQRWYVIGRNPYYAHEKEKANAEGKTYSNPIFRVYGLDRVTNVTTTQNTFVLNGDFSIESFFEGCCGIISSNQRLEHVVIRAFWQEPDYLRSLPLHPSQKEISRDTNSTTFSLDVKPTLDFYQLILSKGENIEVLEPESVRIKMKKILTNMAKYYE